MQHFIATIILGFLTLPLSAQHQNAQTTSPAGTTERSAPTRAPRPSASDNNNARRPAQGSVTPKATARTVLPSLLEAPKLPTYSEQLNASAANQSSAKHAGTYNRTTKTPVRKKQEAVRINWMTFEQAIEKSKVEKRKVIIDVYTDWCSWCKRMDSTTFASPAVANYINEKFYPVRLNAEQQQDIVFKDKTYRFRRATGTGNGCHEIVLQWVNNNLKYPTLIVLDEQQNLIQALPGYQEPAKMEAIIHYFGDDYHKKTPWESFERSFVPMPIGGAQE